MMIVTNGRAARKLATILEKLPDLVDAVTRRYDTPQADLDLAQEVRELLFDPDVSGYAPMVRAADAKGALSNEEPVEALGGGLLGALLQPRDGP